MTITLGTHASGEQMIQLLGVDEATVAIDIEPSAEGEEEHLYVTIELDGETFEGRLPKK